MALLDDVGKILAHGHQQANRLEAAAARLTGPRPQEVGKAEKPAPTQPTLEHQMLELQGVAQALVDRLESTASHLDTTV
jgi:hypothetical protein